MKYGRGGFSAGDVFWWMWVVEMLVVADNINALETCNPQMRKFKMMLEGRADRNLDNRVWRRRPPRK